MIIDKSKIKTLYLYIIVTICVIIIFFSFQILLPQLISIGVLSIKYENYIGQEGFKSHKIDLFFLAALLFILRFLIMNKIKNIKIYNITTILIYIAFCLTLLGGIVETANRSAYYFVIPLWFLLPMVSNNKLKQKQIILFSTLFLVLRFVYSALTTNISDTIPYVSKILNI